MRSLSQDATPDALPDFRNLGVVARILVIVNVLGFVAAAVRASDFTQLVGAFLEIALLLEPILITSLLALYVANAGLARLPYPSAVAAVIGMVLLLTAAAYLLQPAGDATPAGLVRTAASATLVTGFLVAYFHLRNRAFSPALAEARLQALQARIRPHFLFNSLNAVLSLIRTDTRRAETAIEDLAELYRMLLADTRTLTTLKREIELTRQYLNLEQLRLGPRLVVDWRLDEAPLDALVPPLLLQPLVENAVYHGIEPGLGPGTIEIAIRQDHDRVRIRLTNPYHPEHQHRQGNRMALANIRERLQLHFDAEARMESGVVGSNYEIAMQMPYRRAA
ncbi:MAG: histidine kinase [Burkholderiales bacterium]|nr:histidine kinase [Burkholderiales bacterium]